MGQRSVQWVNELVVDCRKPQELVSRWVEFARPRSAVLIFDLLAAYL
jgi:hypothetical protein